MLKFPRKEEGKQEKKQKEGENKGKKGGEEGERKKERKVKGQNGDRMAWYIGKEEESVYKGMKVLGLLPGRKLFFWTLE